MRALLGVGADWLYLYLPPAVVAFVAWLCHRDPAATPVVLGTVAAFPGLAHILSTGFVYLDEDNRALFGRRRWTYYGAPVLIVPAAAALTLASREWAAAILLGAAVFHNTRQSTGILNLTRRRGGAPLGPLRGIEEALVWVASLAFLAWRYAPALNDTPAVTAVRTVALLAVLGTTAVYLRRLWSTRARPPAAHAAFLLISATLAWPLVAANGVLLAWALMSLPHQAQYLGVFWISQRRRYAGQAGRAPRLLRALASEPVACLSALACVAWALQSLQAAPLGGWERSFELAITALTLAHYWLDGFLWRARDAEIRPLFVGPLLAAAR